MLPVVLFIAFWVVLAFGAFFIAVRGGLGRARETLYIQTRGARRTATLLFVVIYIGFGVVLPVAFLTGNHANASSQYAGTKLTASEKQGRQLFAQHCGVCHTLAAANAVGKVGPNLDLLRPPESLVLHTIMNGCLQSPPSPNDPEACLGQGVMPADIIQGKQAQEVAAFVAAVAGKA